MKLDREFSFDELPERVRTSITELVTRHVEALVNDYSETLRQDTKYIGWDEKEYLVERISQAAKITVKISAKCDAEVLSNCKVYPRDLYQNKLDDFVKAQESTIEDSLNGSSKIIHTDIETIEKAVDMLECDQEGSFSHEELESLEAKDAALYEKRKAAAKDAEEG